MNHIPLTLIAGFSLAALNACSPSISASGGGGSANSGSSSWSQAIRSNHSNLRSTSMADLKGLNIPIIQSSSINSSWGAPKVEKSGTGYRLSYADPKQSFQRLVIYGSKTPFPALKSAPNYTKDDMVNGELTSVSHSQKWRSPISVAGSSARWFMESGSGGADGAYYSTEGFSISSNGQTGYYRLVAESGEGSTSERNVARWFSSVK